jgi:hypothetical protein
MCAIGDTRGDPFAECHGTDSDEPWHDDVDEETFRPWRGALPADPSEGMLLVVATLTLNDGTTLDGFITPAFLKDQDRYAEYQSGLSVQASIKAKHQSHLGLL